MKLLIGGIDFGDGPRWHNGCLWYSDFHQKTVYSVDLNGERKIEFTMDDQPSGLGWMPDGSMLVVSMINRQVLHCSHGFLELSVSSQFSIAANCRAIVVRPIFSGPASKIECATCPFLAICCNVSTTSVLPMILFLSWDMDTL